MAEHTIETRILLRYDTLSNWMNSTVILKEGEVAIAKLPYNNTLIPSDAIPANTPPAIGLKVGDGESYFYELPWIQAIAADVYNWAKQSTKPSYSVGEIAGLPEYINEQIANAGGGGGSGGGSSTVAARIYQLVRGVGENSNKYYLQYKTADDTNWTVDTAHYIDLSQLETLIEWIGSGFEDYFTLGSQIYDQVNTEFQKLTVSDSAEVNKVVVAVNQINGKIFTTKNTISLNNLTGTLGVAFGGTGVTSIEENYILVGTNNDTFAPRLIDSVIEDNDNLATNHAIKQYVDNATAGLSGAMHYIGEATVEINPATNPYVNPQIPGYNFNNVQPGDVITQNYKEFVWSGGWHLLGDEASYAIKGSIVDTDISAEANISQSKIFNLTNTLAGKVNVEDGKGLSSNDYTTAEKNKLLNIEDGAQVNAIEHIFVNDIERPIITVNGQPKSITLSIDVFDEEHANKLDGIQSGAQVNTIEHIFVNGEERLPTTINNIDKSVNIIFNPYTTADQQKLQNIEAEAQVNKIEKIFINNIEYAADANKIVNITLDQAALSLNVVEGAEIPPETGNERDQVQQINKKLQFNRIAVTANVKELTQTNDTYIILDCGTSSSDSHPTS